MRTDALSDPALADRLQAVFGRTTDSMPELESRARDLLSGHRAIVWEGDAATFQFSFVSRSAEEILGYPVSRWTTEPTFWADSVVHPLDRSDAIAYCALATGQGRDHDFVYRAVAADGAVVWLHDVVRVVMGPRGMAQRLRGIMLDVTDTLPAPEPGIPQ